MIKSELQNKRKNKKNNKKNSRRKIIDLHKMKKADVTMKVLNRYRQT